MSEKQKTPTWAIVMIAVLSVLLLSFFIWIITHKVDSIDLGSKITVENWFSYLVTLISILITLFVGFQIFNSIEVRRELKDAEGKYEELKNDSEQFKADFRGFQSKLEKEMGAFKLELLNKYNVTERELMKELNENTQKVDWYLKDLKKEHWDRLNDLNESIGKSKKTQEDIKKEMDDFLDKWGTIQEKQEESCMDISKALFALSHTYPDEEIKVYLLISSVEIHPTIENHESGLNVFLDQMLDHLDNIDKLKHNPLVQEKARNLRNIHLDNFTDKEGIEKKINKILYLIDEKTPLAEEEKKKDS
ncbi:MAG: hypothetical protein K6D59_11245 [Bacteroidales bacterium]|nr:hypothetical protein [Bacteroidales bacterium]